MKTAIPFKPKTETCIKYIYELNRRFYYTIHPVLWNYYQLDIDNKLPNGKDNGLIAIKENTLPYNKYFDFNYYLGKYQYLKSNNFFSEKNYIQELQTELSSSDIENVLYSLNNIVFEVTDSCNLNCKYCGYGDMYYDHDERKHTFLHVKTVKVVMDFLTPFLSKSTGILYVGFYGGEPLLNTKMIKESVKFIKDTITTREVRFSMTTNGILLNKHIDFLVQNQFKLMVSIDGNEYHHSYRTFKSGKNSFRVLFRNLKMVKEKYPEYFDKHVSFNTVLHNRNSAIESHSFLFKEFNKVTKFSPLDDAGINPDKMGEFASMYNDVYQNMELEHDKSQMISERFVDDPNVYRLAMFMKYRLAYTEFNSYNDFFIKDKRRIPGGTCLPFQKKMFITVNHKILPCERIDQNYVLGNIRDEKVNLDFEKITSTYNNYYRNIKKQCHHCYNAESCLQCFFQIDEFNKDYRCHAYTNAESFSKTLTDIITFLEKHPDLPQKIVNEVILK